MDNHLTAPIDDRLRAALTFLQKMTLEPHALDADDARMAHKAGVEKEALIGAARVAFTFNLIDRLADSFEFEVSSSEVFSKMALTLLKQGYRI